MMKILMGIMKKYRKSSSGQKKELENKSNENDNSFILNFDSFNPEDLQPQIKPKKKRNEDDYSDFEFVKENNSKYNDNNKKNDNDKDDKIDN